MTVSGSVAEVVRAAATGDQGMGVMAMGSAGSVGGSRGGIRMLSTDPNGVAMG